MHRFLVHDFHPSSRESKQHVEAAKPINGSTLMAFEALCKVRNQSIVVFFPILWLPACVRRSPIKISQISNHTSELKLAQPCPTTLKKAHFKAPPFQATSINFVLRTSPRKSSARQIHHVDWSLPSGAVSAPTPKP